MEKNGRHLELTGGNLARGGDVIMVHDQRELPRVNELVISSGRGANGAPEGKIRFQIGNEDVLVFEPGGRVLVRGEVVEDNKQVWEAVRDWFARAGLAWTR